MGRKRVEIGGGSNYRAWKEWEEGDIIEGEYLSLGTDNYDNPSYKIKVSACSFNEKLVGKNFTLNSNGGLNMKMEEVDIGQHIWIEYEGTGIGEKGKYKGKMFHAVKVGLIGDDEDEAEPTGNAEDDL